MSFCSACGNNPAQDAELCPECGATAQEAGAEQEEPAYQEWFSFEGLLSVPSGMLGTLGVVIVIIGAFLPWANLPATNLGGHFVDQARKMGYTVSDNAIVQARLAWGWLIALASMCGFLALLKRGAGVVTCVFGLIIVGYALICALFLAKSGCSAASGLHFTILGGAVMIYSGFTIGRTEPR